MRFLYTGCFFESAQLNEKLLPIERKILEKVVDYPHITFEFKPSAVDVSLFGKVILATIVGYASSRTNEGVSVKVFSDNDVLQRIISQIEIPHITLSLREGARAKDTRYLKYDDIVPIEIRGVYGAMSSCGVPIIKETINL